MNIWQVIVRYDGESLTVESPDITLQRGDSVQWTFLGIPNTSVPQISFGFGHDENRFALASLGPFTGLVQRRSSILGQGNTGHPLANYRYRAQVFLADDSLLAESAIATLGNQAESAEFATEIDITAVKGADGALSLEISDETSVLRPGSVMTWNFFVPRTVIDLPWVPEVRFKPRLDQPLNHFFGPFLSLSVLSVGERLNPRGDHRVMKVVAAGNNGILGHYNYYAAIVAAGTRRRLAITSPDPVVDNSGMLTLSP